MFSEAALWGEFVDPLGPGDVDMLKWSVGILDSGNDMGLLPDTRHALAVMHFGITLKSMGEIVPGIPGTCATCNSKYLVRGPSTKPLHERMRTDWQLIL